EMSDPLVARAPHEGILRQLKAKQYARRAGTDLAGDAEPRRVGLTDSPEQPAPFIWPRVGLQQRDAHRPTGSLDEAAQHREFRLRLIEVGDHLQPARAGLTQADRD